MNNFDYFEAHPIGKVNQPIVGASLDATLAGVVPFGGTPELLRLSSCPTWPSVLRHEGCEIAIDGYFVLDDRLYIGRSAHEQAEIASEVTQDLRGFLNRVQNGFFNAVINDFHRRETRIVSDGFGGLPLYLLREPDRVVFASTLATVERVAKRRPAKDSVGLAELYWFGYQLGDRTALRGVEHLPAGTIITIKWSDGAETRERLDLESPAPHMPGTPEEMAEYLVDTMMAATKRLHRSDIVVGAKVSAGMDSRLICGCWPDKSLRAYTHGFPTAQEVVIASQLARALGISHRVVPVTGDFFTKLHAPIFPRHGLMDFFHHASVPAMRSDGVSFALDGLAGDVLLGGLTLKRSHMRWRESVGLTPKHERIPDTDEEIASYILGQIRVADDYYRPLSRDAQANIAAAWDAIHADMVGEVQRARRRGETLAQIYTEVSLRNRTRRNVSLQGTLGRPEVETLYPFLDRAFMSLRGLIPRDWVANKRLYVTIYSRFLPAIRSVPTLLSLLPFSVPAWTHYAGRLSRFAAEQTGLRLSYLSSGRINLWAMNAGQWTRWLALNEQFREGARVFMRSSSAFDESEFSKAVRGFPRGPKLSGARFMYTASYCGHFR